MLIPFDPSLLLSFLSIILVILLPMLAIGKDPLLLKIVRGIENDLKRINRDLLDKARKYSHGKKLSGKKLRIHRLLGDFPEDNNTPRFIAAVAGLSVIGCVFCLFFAAVTYVYSGIKNDSFFNWILLSGQICLFQELVVYWFGKTFNVTGSTLFLLYSGFVSLLGLAVGAVLSFSGFYFHVIPMEFTKWFYLGALLVPFAPIITALFEILGFLNKERGKYKRLKKAVSDFESFKKESGKNSKN